MLLALIAAAGLGAPPISTNLDAWQQASTYAQPAGPILSLNVRIELTVDTDGKPIHCTMLSSDKPKGFDGAYCQIPLRRAHFRPALDEEGRPIVGVFSTSFYWHDDQHGHGPVWTDYMLTVNGLPPRRSPVMIARVTTDVAGHVENCAVQASSGVAALDDVACAYTRSTLSFTPAADRDGHPVRAMRALAVGFAAAPTGTGAVGE